MMEHTANMRDGFDSLRVKKVRGLWAIRVPRGPIGL